MEVYITVDTECTEERLVRGHVRPPLGFDVMMRGRFEGHKAGLGTDLIVSELGRYDFHATFFVEPLCAEYFGTDGLAAVCSDLRKSGHDTQLHLHPNFRRPEWRQTGLLPLPDNICDYDLGAQRALLADGVALLAKAGVPRSSIVAFRAGNYGASNATWQALKDVGFSVDSSLNLWAVGRDCQIVTNVLRNDLFEAIPGVWELPVTCFAESKGYRHLEITAISSAEMRYALTNLQESGTTAATIVTHPGEFFVVDDPSRLLARPNYINIARLRSLLSFLHRFRDRFTVRTVGWLAMNLPIQSSRDGTGPAAIPVGSAGLRLARLPVQALKRVLMRPRIPQQGLRD